jgi:uncharacterized membrane protein
VSDEQRAPAKPRPRIESLSDMIFGLALSVGAITLVSSPPTTFPSVLGDVATFGFSFLILINIWLRYTKIMSVLPLESRGVVDFNILLLFLVSIEPFLFNLVNKPPAVSNPAGYENGVSSVYGLDLGMMFLILGIFTFILADEERNLIPKELVSQFRREAFGYLVGASCFFVSVLPFFYTLQVDGSGPIRYYIWLVPLTSILTRRWATRLGSLNRKKDQGTLDSATSSSPL